MGTMRLLITKPISRTQFILAKFTAAATYTMMLLIWMAFLALFVSMWVFGTDSMVNLKSSYIVMLDADDVFWRYVGAFCFASLAMITVAALGFFLSLFAENSIGPIVATMSIIIVFTIFSTLDIPLFNAVKPFLFTTHMIKWKEFFDIQVTVDNETIKGTVAHWDRILTSAGVLLTHIVLLVGASIVIFKKKDVLS